MARYLDSKCTDAAGRESANSESGVSPDIIIRRGCTHRPKLKIHTNEEKSACDL
jgi:hypothetical protein